MSVRNTRLTNLEPRWRRLHQPEVAHHLPIVLQPWDAPDRGWWRAELTCACGVVGCPDLSIGAMLPEKAPSAEAWLARDQHYARRMEVP